MSFQSSARRPQAGDRIWCKPAIRFSQIPRQTGTCALCIDRNRCERRERILHGACENHALPASRKGFRFLVCGDKRRRLSVERSLTSCDSTLRVSLVARPVTSLAGLGIIQLSQLSFAALPWSFVRRRFAAGECRVLSHRSHSELLLIGREET
jgi:hypothetical protein